LREALTEPLAAHAPRPCLGLQEYFCPEGSGFPAPP
jgi:hypothetical protein